MWNIVTVDIDIDDDDHVNKQTNVFMYTWSSNSYYSFAKCYI